MEELCISFGEKFWKLVRSHVPRTKRKITSCVKRPNIKWIQRKMVNPQRWEGGNVFVCLFLHFSWTLTLYTETYNTQTVRSTDLTYRSRFHITTLSFVYRPSLNVSESSSSLFIHHWAYPAIKKQSETWPRVAAPSGLQQAYHTSVWLSHLITAEAKRGSLTNLSASFISHSPGRKPECVCVCVWDLWPSALTALGAHSESASASLRSNYWDHFSGSQASGAAL